MAVPVRLTFRGMEPSASSEEQVQKRADELAQFHSRIVACKVMLEEATRHRTRCFASGIVPCSCIVSGCSRCSVSRCGSMRPG